MHYFHFLKKSTATIMSEKIVRQLQKAIHYFEKRQFSSADKLLCEILIFDSSNFDALYLKGLVCGIQSNHLECKNYLLRALKLNSNHAYLQYNLAKALSELGEDNLALKHHEIAVVLMPTNPHAWLNFGRCLFKQQLLNDSLRSYEAAINLKSDYAEAYSNRGLVLNELNRFDEALQSYDKAIQLKPDYSEAFCNRGLVLNSLKRFDEALHSYDKAIEYKNDFSAAYNNRGILLNELTHFDEALQSYDKAIELSFDYADAHNNRGILLNQLNRYDEALQSYLKAIEFKPDYEYLPGTIIFQRLAICDWGGLTQSLMLIESEIFEDKKVINPFTCIGLFDNPHSHFLVSKNFTEFNFPKNNALGEISNPPHHGKLRIGYYSADLYYHPASIWLAEQLENHDRSKFELIAFSLKSISDPMKDRLKTAFDHWVDVRDLSDLELVQISRDLKIDIAIDLNTHTLDSRLGIFAARVAPIQVMNIGYPGSSGAQYIDYFLSDSYGVSQDNRPYFSEKIAFVPSLTTYDRQREVSNEPLYRSQFGLPETGFVFTCQNGCQKFNPDVFDIWMEILKAVPGSVLWLLKPNESAIQNLIKEAQIRGIDSERLIFTDREVVPMEQEKNRISRYLASYKLADLFLDTWPYNAGTTAVDALWAGTPVLTKVGNAISARMCYSALKHIELAELITYTANEYRNLAISLATDPDRLKLIKEKLEKNRLSTALFDPVGNTRHIENAYLEMYRRYSEGLPPSDIYIGA